jgi:hypothetical protein
VVNAVRKIINKTGYGRLYLAADGRWATPSFTLEVLPTMGLCLQRNDTMRPHTTTSPSTQRAFDKYLSGDPFPKSSGSDNKILFGSSFSLRFLYPSFFAGSSGSRDSLPRLLGSVKDHRHSRGLEDAPFKEGNPLTNLFLFLPAFDYNFTLPFFS